ncbi:MAG: hypothetical protein ACWA5W_09655 [Phycisphaerales bacterium]
MRTQPQRTISTLAILIAAILALLLPACSSIPRAPESHSQHHTPTSLNNVFQLTDSLYSGAEPRDRSAYEDLQSMGIRTLISVDAIAPNASLAGEYNIRVIHLPIGYAGISKQRIKELAFAIQSSFKPIYVHCHQGKHRGPAALCAGALALGMMTHEEANAFMTSAGTSPKYTELWSAVEQTEKLATVEPMPLSDHAPTRSISKTMSKIGKQTTILSDIIYPKTNPIGGESTNPAQSPAVYAAQVHNLFRTLETNDEAKEYVPEFISDLQHAIQSAKALEKSLDMEDPIFAMDALDALQNSCSRCHDKL